MSSILPRQPGPLGLPYPILWLIDKLAGLFKRPKKNEEPEDVAERSHQTREFCDMVNANARQTEEAVVTELRRYADWLSRLNEQEEYRFLQKYRIQTRAFVRQVELATMQIPGLIASEVSKHLSETDPEFQRIRYMLPGAEKERVMREFMERIISGAVERSAGLCEQIMEGIQEDFSALLEESLDQSRRQLEKKEQEFQDLQSAGDNAVEKERIQVQAQQISDCCALVENILGEE